MFGKIISVVYLLILVVVTSNSLAQKQANNWYFGQNAGLSFATGSPVTLLNGQLNTNEGCATLSDSSGNLLFYTDGITVYNKAHAVMANGTGLTGDPSSTHSAIIIPMPCNDTLFYIFTVDNEAGPNGIRYSLVNIVPNGGNGVVTIKNQSILTPATEKLTAVSHCNGTDVWMIAHGWNNNNFYSWRISCDSIEDPVISGVGIKHPIDTLSTLQSIGQMKVSPLGDKLAIVIYTGGDTAKTTIQLFDFDNYTGVISNPLKLPGYGPMYGLEFSPDGSKLYVSATTGGSFGPFMNRCFQFDISSSDTNTIKLSRTEIFAGEGLPNPPGQIQIATDGKLYIARTGDTTIDRINNPNLPGLACEYQEGVINLMGRQSRFGLPPFNQKYLLDPSAGTFSYSNPCDSFQITFTAPLTPKYSSWLWNFGDPASGTADTSTVENPVHIFSDTGDYIVQLIATGVCRTDTFIKSLSIDTVPFIDAGKDTFVCFGNSVTLGGAPSGPNNGIYLWEPKIYLNVDTIANPVSTPYVTISYSLSVKEGAECTAYDTVSVIVGPYIDAGPGGSICNSEDSVLLGGAPTSDPSFTFSWSPSTGMNDTTLPNPKVSPTSSTNYVLLVTDTVGCMKTDTVTVLVFDSTEQVSFTFSGKCSGIQSFINTSTSGFDKWLWNFGDTNAFGGFLFGNTSTDFQPLFGHFYSTSGIYTVTLIGYTEGTCLRDTFQQDIVVGNFFVDAMPNDTTICRGDTLQLNIVDSASAEPITYLWTPNNQVNDDTIKNPIVYPIDTVTYTISVTSGGCLIKDSIHIDIGGYADAGNDTIICKNNDVVIGGLPSILPGSILQWTPPTYLDNDTSVNPSFSGDSAGNYIYQLITTDSWGCIDTDQITILVNELPSVNAGNDTSICEDELLFIGNNTLTSSNTYLWKPVIGLSDSLSGYTQVILEVDSITEINYLLVVTDTNECAAEDSVFVTIHPTPSVDVSVDGEKSILTVVNAEKVFNGVASDAGSNFTWSPAIYLNDTTLLSPTFYPTDTGTITYILSSSSNYGCVASDTLFVKIIKETVLTIPDIFSPNNDGENDVLYAYEIGLANLELFTIIDRWGNIVFETNNINTGWDGTYDGKKSPIGVYLVELKGSDVLGEKKHIVNHKVTLIR